MPKYKLTYFNARGRAELARFIFAVAGQEYEDFRFEHAEWPNYKASTPFGKAPVLEIDGVAICQSKTIARYLAKEFGLAGETNLEQAQADLLVETLHDDLLDMMIPLFKEPDETKKAELRKQFTEEYYPNLLTTLQTRLTENGGEFFVGKSLTWADLAVVDALGWIKALDMDTSLDKYPVLKKHQENIIAIPKLAEWLKNRPDTPR